MRHRGPARAASRSYDLRPTWRPTRSLHWTPRSRPVCMLEVIGAAPVSFCVGEAQMNSSEIDSAILAVAQTSWRKVGMVIVKASEQLGPALPDGDAGYKMIAQRVEALVQ